MTCWWVAICHEFVVKHWNSQTWFNHVSMPWGCSLSLTRLLINDDLYLIWRGDTSWLICHVRTHILRSYVGKTENPVLRTECWGSIMLNCFPFTHIFGRSTWCVSHITHDMKTCLEGGHLWAIYLDRFLTWFFYFRTLNCCRGAIVSFTKYATNDVTVCDAGIFARNAKAEFWQSSKFALVVEYCPNFKNWLKLIS